MCTLDYKNKIPQEMFNFDIKPFFMPHHGVFEWPTINNEIACVNDPTIVNDMEKWCHQRKCHEQEAMNYIYFLTPERIKIVDFPYEFSRVVYNNRAKGWLGSECVKSGKFHFGLDGPQIGEFSPIYVWKPIGDKLYNQDGKHVKAFHFCTQKQGEDPTKEWFNDETVKFFVEHCACEWNLPFKVMC
jgi:hypothetical protein